MEQLTRTRRGMPEKETVVGGKWPVGPQERRAAIGMATDTIHVLGLVEGFEDGIHERMRAERTDRQRYAAAIAHDVLRHGRRRAQGENRPLDAEQLIELPR